MTAQQSATRTTQFVRARFRDSDAAPLTLMGMSQRLTDLQDLIAVHELVDGLSESDDAEFASLQQEARNAAREIQVLSTHKGSPWDLVMWSGAASSAVSSAIGAAILTFRQVQAAREDKAYADIATARSAAYVAHWDQITQQILHSGDMSRRHTDAPPPRLTALERFKNVVLGRTKPNLEISMPDTYLPMARPGARMIRAAERAMDALDDLSFVDEP